VTKVVPASAEKASDVEAAPAIGPQPEEPAATADGQQGSVARREGSKRGRPKTGEERGESEGQARENGRSRCLTLRDR